MNGALRNTCSWRRRQGRRARTERYLDEENITDIEGATPTPKRRRVARDAGLAASLSFGHYLEYLGMHGPSQDLNPKDSSPFSLSTWTLL